MKKLLFILFALFIAIIEFSKSFGMIILPISASLFLLIASIAVWRITLGAYMEKKYTILFLSIISLYTIGTILNVFMYS